IYLKGYDILLKAFAQLVSQNHNSFRLIIGGEGKEKKYLQRLAVRLKIGDKVTFTGNLDRLQVRQNLQMANVFVHPSRLESFGVVLIEAMACGLPLITTRCGGPEYIVTPETGLLVEPDNSGKLSDAMSYFVQNYNNYNRDGIRKFAMEHFNQHDVALQYLSLFKQLDLGQI
ncbi:MAG: glycosyltransferase, partial [Bacteroidota bacterium]|nr:glycosyltransferase [Bacteroidota bacterium]